MFIMIKKPADWEKDKQEAASKFVKEQNLKGLDISKSDIEFHRATNLEVVGSRINQKEAFLILISVAIGVGYL